MNRWFHAAAVVLLCCSNADAQTAPAAGCSLQNTDHYTCSAAAFARLLAEAKTVRLDTGRMDAYGRSRMRKLAAELNKNIAIGEERPDLVMELSWIDRSGRIDFGPADVAVARLNVYDPSLGAGDRSLVWVETLDGKEDEPWPAMVTQLIHDFRQHVAANDR